MAPLGALSRLVGQSTVDARCRCVLAQQRVDAVSHAFDLFDITAFNLTKLENLAIGRGEEHMIVWIQWASTWFESAVEKRCEVGVDMEIRFGYFVKIDSKDERI